MYIGAYTSYLAKGRRMGKPHVLLLPYPVQGHVIPLMELAQCLANHGFKITFVNTEETHKLVMNAMADEHVLGDEISMVSIPDGVEAWKDRRVPGKLSNAISHIMPAKFEDLIQQLNKSEGSNVTCIIADRSLPWAMEVATKMGIKRAAFLPAAAALFVLGLHIPKLIDEGVINTDGTPIKKQIIQLSPTMPAVSTENLVWMRVGNLTMQKTIFDLIEKANKSVKLSEWMICNSSYELEPGALTSAQQLFPIGPLLASNRLGSSSGFFWPEDYTCLKWLDQQPTCSVIYVAFGSLTVFNQTQFQELALGLELSERPFLWVVRPDFTDGRNEAYPEGFLDRVGSRGQMVGWAPQQKVLSHPSVACFLSHCGWNSTMEGVSNGVPFLCWPYFADQFLNETYICDVWKVGLGFERDVDSGVIAREEIKNKVEQLLGDDTLKARALNMKEMAVKSVREGGSSYKNFNNFIEWMKT